MASLSEEEDNYVRMSLLLTGISPCAVRTCFDYEFAPACLEASLKKEYNKLFDLKKERESTNHSGTFCFQRFPASAKLKTSQPGLLETWFNGVERFGRLNISVPFSLDIESLDPQEYSDMGKLFIRLNYTPEEKESQTEHINNISLAALTKLYSFNIDTSDKNDIRITAKFNTMVNFPATCSIQMPINYDNLYMN
ncbi:unnamed protein product [Mytilus edulis]|uniref:Uncharacterized protein n=1 Tax=Mytilus edulis TaxID=6550 RepID=A0A8S3RTD1_MYTED|nr:unnamed protein product [Mytilus edulis]